MDQQNTQPTPQVTQQSPVPVVPPQTVQTRSKLPLILGGIFVLLLIAGGSYFAGTQMNKTSSATPTPSPLAEQVSPTTVETVQTTETPLVTSAPITIPSTWKKFTATDSDFGVTTTMSLPTGYSFAFTGSEYTIQNDSDATELWGYTTSIFSGKDGIKNYYSGESRRVWYQNYLDGKFASPGSVQGSTKINSVTDKGSYLEVSITSYDTHINYLFVQNNIVHIIFPASEVAFKTTSSPIKQNMGIIVSSLTSRQTK